MPSEATAHDATDPVLEPRAEASGCPLSELSLERCATACFRARLQVPRSCRSHFREGGDVGRIPFTEDIPAQ